MSSGAGVTLKELKCWNSAQWLSMKATWCSRGTVKRTNKRYFLQTHILEQTHFFPSKQVQRTITTGKRRAEEGASIFKTVKKSHIHYRSKKFPDPGKNISTPCFILSRVMLWPFCKIDCYVTDISLLWSCLFVHNVWFCCVSSFMCPSSIGWCK